MQRGEGSTLSEFPQVALTDQRAGLVQELDPVKVYDATALPRVWQLVVPTLWVTCMSLVPLMPRLVGSSAFTRSEMNLAIVMWTTLYGGLYLFTNVIRFNSSHWVGSRPLTGLECVYFMATCITTVGYGDITPASPRCKVFVALYILGGLFVVSHVISDSVSRLSERLFEQEEEKQQQQAQGNLAEVLKSRVDTPSFRPVIQALATVIFFSMTWTLCLHYIPGENKSWVDSMYNAVVTMSTVGFGATTPDTQLTMAMASVWMVLGTAALANLVGEYSKWRAAVRIMELADAMPQESEAIHSIKQRLRSCSADGQVTEVQFLRACLQASGHMGEDLAQELSMAWGRMGPESGHAPIAVIESCLDDQFGEDSGRMLQPVKTI